MLLKVSTLVPASRGTENRNEYAWKMKRKPGNNPPSPPKYWIYKAEKKEKKNNGANKTVMDITLRPVFYSIFCL